MAKTKFRYAIQDTNRKEYFKGFFEPKHYSMWTCNTDNAMMFDNEIEAESIIGEIDGVLEIIKFKA